MGGWKWLTVELFLLDKEFDRLKSWLILLQGEDDAEGEDIAPREQPEGEVVVSSSTLLRIWFKTGLVDGVFFGVTSNLASLFFRGQFNASFSNACVLNSIESVKLKLSSENTSLVLRSEENEITN